MSPSVQIDALKSQKRQKSHFYSSQQRNYFSFFFRLNFFVFTSPTNVCTTYVNHRPWMQKNDHNVTLCATVKAIVKKNISTLEMSKILLNADWKETNSLANLLALQFTPYRLTEVMSKLYSQFKWQLRSHGNVWNECGKYRNTLRSALESTDAECSMCVLY